MAVLEEVAPPDLTTPVERESSRREALISLGAFAVYAVAMAVVVVRHEPWFDEAQSWLIARDSNLVNLFQRIPYEGQPGLWHLMLMIPAKLLPYRVINWISGLLGAAGAYLFLRRSPFPIWLKVLVPFTYFFFYQYGVVARNYALLPVVMFGVAVLYPKRHTRPLAFAALVFVLANTSTHGYLIAAGLLAIMAVELAKQARKRRALPDRSNLVALGSAGAGMLLVALILRPPADRTFAAEGVQVTGIESFLQAIGRMLNNSMGENRLLLLVALAASLWFFRRRRVLHVYLVPTAILELFFGLVHRAPWHEGTLFVVWIFAFWVALQQPAPEIQRPDRSRQAAFAALAGVCLVQIAWTVQTSYMDVRAPYSGSRALAAYVKGHDLHETTIYAVHWASFAVNPYFERNIIANYRPPENISYYLWSKKNRTSENLTAFEWRLPDYVIYPIKKARSERRAELSLLSYRQRAVFWGELFWKGRVLQPEVYVLYERMTPPAAKADPTQGEQVEAAAARTPEPVQTVNAPALVSTGI